SRSISSLRTAGGGAGGVSASDAGWSVFGGRALVLIRPESNSAIRPAITIEATISPATILPPSHAGISLEAAQEREDRVVDLARPLLLHPVAAARKEER